MKQLPDIKIFLADDHPLFCAGLKFSLEAIDGFTVGGEASDGYSAVDQLRELPLDIALIDYDMPGLSGVVVVRMIKMIRKELKMLILSTYNDDSYVKAAMQAGADGYLVKNIPIAEMELVIRAVHSGNPCFSPYLVNLSIPEEVAPPHDAFHLTQREREVLTLLAEGKSNKEISSMLFISPETVKSHVKKIYKKLGAANRIEAIITASSQKIL